MLTQERQSYGTSAKKTAGNLKHSRGWPVFLLNNSAHAHMVGKAVDRIGQLGQQKPGLLRH